MNKNRPANFLYTKVKLYVFNIWLYLKKWLEMVSIVDIKVYKIWRPSRVTGAWNFHLGLPDKDNSKVTDICRYNYLKPYERILKQQQK